MLVYEVNLTVDEAVAPRYSTWLREHIRELLNLEGFEAAAWFVRGEDANTIPDGDAPDGPRRWTVHYQVRDRETLQTYFDEHAEAFRSKGLAAFEGHVTAERRILQHRRLFHATHEG